MFEWATSIISQSGYLGVVFAMFMENIFPPIPSELVMLFAGASAGQGDLNIILVIIAAAIGSTLGLVPWYFLGKWYGMERMKELADKYGRVLTFSGGDVQKADDWFKKHGKIAVLVGRFLPAARTFVAIPAAIMKMDLKVFLLFAFLGSLLWDGIFGAVGFYVGENSEGIERYLNIGTYTILSIALMWYVYRVITFRKK